MVNADNLRDANPWMPEQDQRRLKVLGKLAEELGELQAAVGRCIIQGVDGCEPVTDRPNIDWLQDEVADVRNMLNIVESELKLDTFQIAARQDRKNTFILVWLKMGDGI